jgi:hypothetical protein
MFLEYYILNFGRMRNKLSSPVSRHFPGIHPKGLNKFIKKSVIGNWFPCRELNWILSEYDAVTSKFELTCFVRSSLIMRSLNEFRCNLVFEITVVRWILFRCESGHYNLFWNQVIQWRRVLLKKLLVAHLVKKFKAFYGTRSFINVPTRVLPKVNHGFTSTEHPDVHCIYWFSDVNNEATDDE